LTALLYLRVTIHSPFLIPPSPSPDISTGRHPASIMTINHIFLYIPLSRLPTIRAFYRTTLKPLGYTEMIRAQEEKLIGFGSDYPYLWLKAIPDNHNPYPTHIAIDAPNNGAVDEFHQLGL
jgi:hypothetical protein